MFRVVIALVLVHTTAPALTYCTHFLKPSMVEAILELHSDLLLVALSIVIIFLFLLVTTFVSAADCAMNQRVLLPRTAFAVASLFVALLCVMWDDYL